jgi:alanine dehydrogenase
MLRIVVLAEGKNENRVSLIPKDINKLASHYEVFVQTKSGDKCNYSDDDYIKAGAKIFVKLKYVIDPTAIVCKLSSLNSSEKALLTPQNIIITNPFYVNNPSEFYKILKKSLTIIGIENIMIKNNNTYLSTSAEAKANFALANLLYYSSRISDEKNGGLTIANINGVLIINYNVCAKVLISLLIRLGMKVILADSIITKEQVITDLQSNSQITGLNPILEVINSDFEKMVDIAKSVNAIVYTMDDNAKPSTIKVTYDMFVGMPKGSVFINLSMNKGTSCDFIEKPSTVKTPYIKKCDRTIINIENITSLYPISVSISISDLITTLLLNNKDNRTYSSLIANDLINVGLYTKAINGKITIVNNELKESLKL